MHSENQKKNKDAEGRRRLTEEGVRVIANKWRTDTVVGKLCGGKSVEANAQTLQSATGCEWYSKLLEIDATGEDN